MRATATAAMTPARAERWLRICAPSHCRNAALGEETPQGGVGLAQLGQRPARRLSCDRELERVAAHRAEHVQRQRSRQRVERLAWTGHHEADGALAEELAPAVVAGAEVQRGAQ